jgi:ubiquinone/menaquinone biosynthesis C-methylase UbiE
VGDLPVVVDFERSVMSEESVSRMRASAGAGPSIARRGGSSILVRRLSTWLKRVWKPVNQAATQGIAAILAELPAGSLVLVVGGGTVGNGTEALYEHDGIRVVAFDIYASPMVHFLADGHEIPLASASVDAVVVQAVLEHVIDPALVVAEIHRVLKADGLVYAETPFMQHVHAGRHDFTRFTASGHRWLFRRFTEISAGAVAGPGTTALWSIDHLARALTRSQQAGRLVRLPLLWLRNLDRIADPRAALDAASAVFFLGRRSDREMSTAELLRYYGGAQQ